MELLGYPRPNGTFGIRNHVAVVASVSCANGVVEAVHRELGAKRLTHTEGCGRGPQDLVNTTRTLMGLGRNPNVAAVLVVGLGCEFLKAPMIAGGIAESKKPVETLVIQDSGGSQRTIEKAIEVCRKLLDHARAVQRTAFGWDRLTVGFECGGVASGPAAAAAPALGACAEWLLGRGATVIFPELSAMAGRGAAPAVAPAIASRIEQALDARRRTALKVLGEAGVALEDAARGARLSALAMRSAVDQVLDYAQPPSRGGLCVMDTPPSDAFALTGLAAAGAHLVVQTTDHGNPAGFPIVPVVKVATRPGLYEQMRDDLDLDGSHPAGDRDLSREIADLVSRVAAGESTCAEVNDYEVMAIQTLGPAF